MIILKIPVHQYSWSLSLNVFSTSCIILVSFLSLIITYDQDSCSLTEKNSTTQSCNIFLFGYSTESGGGGKKGGKKKGSSFQTVSALFRVSTEVIVS